MDMSRFIFDGIFSELSRRNLGIAVLKKQVAIWGLVGAGRCCEPLVGLGQWTGGGPGSSTVFLIQNASFILNLVIFMTLKIQCLYCGFNILL